MTRYGIYPLGDKTDCSGLDCSAYTLANNKIYDGAITEREITIADCSSNQTLVNGACVALSCPAGKKADNHQCVDLNCDSGFYPSGNKCEKLKDDEIYVAGNVWTSKNLTTGCSHTDENGCEFYLSDAIKACSEKGMRLPTISELQSIFPTHVNDFSYEMPRKANEVSVGFWTSESYHTIVRSDTGRVESDNEHLRNNNGNGFYSVLCVK